MTHYLFIILVGAISSITSSWCASWACPLHGVSKKLETAYGMGAATTFVLTLGSGASWIIDNYLLIPNDLVYLRTLAFIVTIAAFVQLTEMVIQKTSPALHQVLGIYLPLITTNCAVLGIPLLAIGAKYDFSSPPLRGRQFPRLLPGAGAVRRHTRRIEGADVPRYFRGNAIALVTAGLMSLAFMGFAGLDKYQ